MESPDKGGNDVTWPKVFALVVSVCGLSIGGLSAAFSWHTTAPVPHAGAASHGDVQRVYGQIDRESKALESRLDRIENRQQAILDILRQR